MKSYLRVFTGLLVVLLAVNLAAEVKLPAIYGSNMVFQRDAKVTVWGWAAPTEKVTVKFNGQTKEAQTDDKGKWQVQLDPMKAGGPFKMEIVGSNTVNLDNILVGDVWICSGQSNMAFAVHSANNSKEEIANANFSEIRFLKVRGNPSLTKLDNVTASWQVCSPKTVGSFSGAGYFFGRRLYQDLKVPIGLVQSAWGGTKIEAWTPLAAQIDDPTVKKMKQGYDKKAETYDEATAKQKYEEDKKAWKEKLKEWQTNGQKGRKPRGPQPPRHPQQHQHYPANLYNGMIAPLTPMAIKGAIWYQGESNAGGAKNYRTQMERLISSWRKAWNQGDFPFYFVQLPNFRTPWKEPAQAKSSWSLMREAFMDTANEVPNTGMAITIDIGEENNIHPKNKQDVGDRLARVALFKTYGNKDIVWTGPIPRDCKFEDGKVTVTFETGGSPLAIKGDKLDGFALVNKGSDQPVKAEAVIQGDDTLVISSPEAKEPVMVYYAWGMNPVGSNLINKAGLPASPFRFGSQKK